MDSRIIRVIIIFTSYLSVPWSADLTRRFMLNSVILTYNTGCHGFYTLIEREDSC